MKSSLSNKIIIWKVDIFRPFKDEQDLTFTYVVRSIKELQFEMYICKSYDLFAYYCINNTIRVPLFFSTLLLSIHVCESCHIDTLYVRTFICESIYTYMHMHTQPTHIYYHLHTSWVPTCICTHYPHIHINLHKYATHIYRYLHKLAQTRICIHNTSMQ